MLMLIAKAMLELGPKETMNNVILLVQRFCLFAEHQETDFPLFIRSDKRSWQKYSKKKCWSRKNGGQAITVRPQFNLPHPVTGISFESHQHSHIPMWPYSLGVRHQNCIHIALSILLGVASFVDVPRRRATNHRWQAREWTTIKIVKPAPVIFVNRVAFCADVQCAVCTPTTTPPNSENEPKKKKIAAHKSQPQRIMSLARRPWFINTISRCDVFTVMLAVATARIYIEVLGEGCRTQHKNKILRFFVVVVGHNFCRRKRRGQ